MDDMDWTDFLIQLLVTTVALAALFGFGYRYGYRKGHTQRIEDMRKNARQEASRAQAEVDVLDSVARPRSRAMRIVSTSRRAMQPGPEE
jgi:hypothetical protein